MMIRRTTMLGMALAAGITSLAGAAQAPARVDPAACEALVGSGTLPQTEITRAVRHAAAGGRPAFCEVQGVIRPVPGSEIGVVYRLPQDWNGKTLALGGGGWMGNVTLQAATEGLTRGYATLQTDAGHTTGTGFDASPWALNPDGTANRPKLEDFSHRAIHLMTQRGRELVATYYGSAARQSYYQGCSTGGRMGMMATQRHPQDFDGVIAMAPVYSLQVQTSAALRSNAFDAPGARLTAAQAQRVTSAVLDACDARDGAADGVLRDPRACDFDPVVLQCAAGATGDECLAPPQVQALRKVYAGERAPDGTWASFPLEKGGEVGWNPFVPVLAAGDPGMRSGGLHALRGPLLGDPAFDMSRFTAKDVPTVRASWLAKEYEATNPDLTAFVARGGKLILGHGFNDPGPSARATVDFYEALQKATRGADKASRLFLAPGVGHCSGGPGPDQVDWLTVIENWVEKGQAPEEVPATKANSQLKWNLCAYPKLPTGTGDGGYACR